jgi:hypothetical protein
MRMRQPGPKPGSSRPPRVESAFRWSSVRILQHAKPAAPEVLLAINAEAARGFQFDIVRRPFPRRAGKN